MPSRSIAESQANRDAGRASRPEFAHSDHGYLSTPLDLRGSLGSKPDNLDYGKELPLEMDGEWFGDAQEAASSAAQKVFARGVLVISCSLHLKRETEQHLCTVQQRGSS